MFNVLFCVVYLLCLTVNIEGKDGGCCILTPQTSLQENSTLQEKFKRYKIVGDYISKAPKNQLIIKLPTNGDKTCKKNARVINIQPGDNISPIESFKFPIVEHPNAVEGNLYALFFLDIDAPSPKNATGRAYIHGIFLNCPANSLLDGDVIVPYSPATPGPGTGRHRYVGLLYKQSKKVNTDTLDLWRLARERIDFSVEVFAKTYGLHGPEAGNFSFVEFNVCGVYDS